MPTHMFLESTYFPNTKYYVFNAKSMENTERHNEKHRCHYPMTMILVLDTCIKGIILKYVSQSDWVAWLFGHLTVSFYSGGGLRVVRSAPHWAQHTLSSESA